MGLAADVLYEVRDVGRAVRGEARRERGRTADEITADFGYLLPCRCRCRPCRPCLARTRDNGGHYFALGRISLLFCVSVRVLQNSRQFVFSVALTRLKLLDKIGYNPRNLVTCG